MKTMRRLFFSLLLCGLGLSGCRSGESNQKPSSSPSPSARPSVAMVKSKVDVCNLLTSDDLKDVQGEAYQDAQRSDRVDGEFIVAQCYYALPTTINSVVVNVTTAKDEAGARSPKGFWEQTFGGDEQKEREGKEEPAREREREKAKEPRAREEEAEAKEASPPQPVKDLGDEAFWVGSPVGGALYVLKNDLFLRLSIGGAGDQKVKLSKSRALAQKILKKL
jgi:hypothetical protein